MGIKSDLLNLYVMSLLLITSQVMVFDGSFLYLQTSTYLINLIFRWGVLAGYAKASSGWSLIATRLFKFHKLDLCEENECNMHVMRLVEHNKINKFVFLSNIKMIRHQTTARRKKKNGFCCEILILLWYRSWLCCLHISYSCFGYNWFHLLGT